jgi:hypothetical protein
MSANTPSSSGAGPAPGIPEAVPKKPTATVVKPDIGTPEPMYAPHARGVLGEQAMGFHLGSQGYHIIEGPSGTATFIDPATGALNGHQITASGFDGIAFHPQTKDLIIYDKKAFQKIGNVADASALTRNLQTNLDKTIGRMERSRQFVPRDGLATFNQALQKLKQARDALAAGRPWPAGCRLAISNAAGNSTGVTERLRRLGVQFIDFNEVRKIRRAPSVIRHIGDAVSGVGGTALSIGAQAATIAGQIKIEMDRAEEKLEDLRKEIAEKDTLPDDGRLRSEFDLDDEAIADLKAEFAAPKEEPEPTDDELPSPPEWAPDNPDLWSEDSELPPGARWVDQPIATRPSSPSHAGRRVA